MLHGYQRFYPFETLLMQFGEAMPSLDLTVQLQTTMGLTDS
jgi:hypothetical protein